MPFKSYEFCCAFVSSLSLDPRRRPRIRSCHSHRHFLPRCAAVKLLVVEIAELFGEKRSASSQLSTFSERVAVDRAAAKETTFLLYSSPLGYKPAMDSIHDAGLVEPDALAALNGLELYQRLYKTPDPYWAKTVGKDWDPKPTRWVLGEYFGNMLKECKESDFEENQLLFRLSGTLDVKGVCDKVAAKFAQMGINARVKPHFQEGMLAVIPATGSVAEVVAFCQMMLRIPEEATYVFGSDALVASCVIGKGNMGICSADSAGSWGEVREQVFVSAKEGVDAIVDGVMYHAIF